MANIDENDYLMNKLYSTVSEDDLKIIDDYLNKGFNLRLLSDYEIKDILLNLDNEDRDKLKNIVNYIIKEISINKSRGKINYRKNIIRLPSKQLIIFIIIYIIGYNVFYFSDIQNKIPENANVIYIQNYLNNFVNNNIFISILVFIYLLFIIYRYKTNEK